jgi:hypothetical protein
MTERTPTEWKRYAKRDDGGVTEPSRLSLAWYLDPTTGKPAARWVVGGPDTTVGQELATAA